MRAFSLTLSLLAIAAVFAQGVHAVSQKSFKGNFIETNNPTIPKAKIAGKLAYDFSSTDSNQWKWRVDWTVGPVNSPGSSSTITEMFKVLVISSSSQTVTQKLRYLVCGTTCNAESQNDLNFRKFFYETGNTIDGTGTTLNGKNCWKFTKTVTQNKEAQYVWVQAGSSGAVSTATQICKIQYKDGTVWDFTDPSLGTNTLTTPTDADDFPSSLLTGCPEPSCQTRADIVLVFDESGSIDDATEGLQMRNFGRDLINKYTFGDDGVYMAYVLFSYSARIIQEFTPDQATMRNAVVGTRFAGGNTCSTAGLTLAHDRIHKRHSSRYKYTPLVVIATDGYDSSGCGATTSIKSDIETTAHLQHPTGGYIIAIGVDGALESALKATSSTTATRKMWFYVAQFSDLSSLLANLLVLTCTTISGNPCGQNCNGFCGCNQQCLCPGGCDKKGCYNEICAANNPGVGCQYQPIPWADSPDYTKCLTTGTCTPNGELSVWGGYTTLNCDDNNACTNDTCDDSIGCQNIDYSSNCKSNQACGINGICFSSCAAGAGSTTTLLGETFHCKSDGAAADGSSTTGLATAAGCADNFHFDFTGGCACSPDPCPHVTCKIAQCKPSNNPQGYECVYTDKSCDTGTACAVSQCVNDVCTPAQGVICDDGLNCTVDTCDQLLGCQYRMKTAEECTDFSNCTEDYAMCNMTDGCYHEPIPCPVSNDICSTGVCRDSDGTCSYVLRNCGEELNTPLCNRAICDATSGCLLEVVEAGPDDGCGVCGGTGDCNKSLTVAEAAGIAAGILAAIIIAAIIGCALLAAAGGKAGLEFYKSYQTKLGDTHMNPMYEAKDMGGENPFYEGQK